MKISTMKQPANLRMKNLLMDGRATSNPCWGRHARNPLRSHYFVEFVVVELDPWSGTWCCPFRAPHTVSLLFFWLLGNRLVVP